MLSKINQTQKDKDSMISLTWEFKIARLLEAESRMMVVRAQARRNGRCWSKGTELCRMIKFWKSNVECGDYS